MNKLLKQVEKLKDSKIKDLIDERIKELKDIGRGNSDELFIELCFCLMTANFDAARAIKIQKAIGIGFLNMKEEELASELKKHGHRFPNARAKYINEAKKHQEYIAEMVCETSCDKEKRKWLAENVKGLGYKESSHFLRNIGMDNCAIIDFHIVDILVDNKIIEKPKALNKKAYFEIEDKLQKMAEKLDLTLAELDFYLWYLETGKILK